MSSLFDKDFGMTQLSGEFLKVYGSDPNVVGYYYDESTGQMHAKMKNGSIATYGANFKRYLATKNLPPKVETENIDRVRVGTSATATRVPDVRPTPPTPPPPPPPPPPVKTAPIDTILFDDTSVPIEIMTDLIFEDIGGQEIISIVRNDTVNGQNVIYRPIKNLSLINQQYNPNNILALQGTSDKYFENFIIKLSNKIPTVGNGLAGKNVYIDTNNADIVIDLINLEQDEQADIQFRIDGTIYEAEL